LQSSFKKTTLAIGGSGFFLILALASLAYLFWLILYISKNY